EPGVRAVPGLLRPAGQPLGQGVPQGAPKMKERLMATFRPQAWVGDYALDTGDDVEFDATGQFLSVGLEAIRNFGEHDYDSDRLAEDRPEAQEHDGPFEVDVDVDAWLADNGISNREAISQDDLDRLRKEYGVTSD